MNDPALFVPFAAITRCRRPALGSSQMLDRSDKPADSAWGDSLAEILFSDRERQPEIEIVSGRLSSTQGQTEPYRLCNEGKAEAAPADARTLAHGASDDEASPFNDHHKVGALVASLRRCKRDKEPVRDFRCGQPPPPQLFSSCLFFLWAVVRLRWFFLLATFLGGLFPCFGFFSVSSLLSIPTKRAEGSA